MIDAVCERRPNPRSGTDGAVGAPAIGDGRAVAVGWASGTVHSENFVVVVVFMNIEGDLVEVLLQIGNGAPHDSNSKRIPRKNCSEGMNYVYICNCCSRSLFF